MGGFFQMLRICNWRSDLQSETVSIGMDLDKRATYGCEAVKPLAVLLSSLSSLLIRDVARCIP